MKYYFIKGTGEGHSDSVIPEGRSKGRELYSYVRGAGGGGGMCKGPEARGCLGANAAIATDRGQ